MGEAGENLDPEITSELQKIAAEPQGRVTQAMMQAAPVFMGDPELRTQLQGTMRKLMEARRAGR